MRVVKSTSALVLLACTILSAAQDLDAKAPSLDRVVINPAFGTVLTAVGDAAIQFQPLDASIMTQLWQLDSSQLLRSTGATNKCVDAPDPQNGGTVRLSDCSATDVNQLWTYDATTKQLRHKTHVDFCLDIGTPTGTKPHLWECLETTSLYLKNQQIDLLAPFLDRVVTNTSTHRDCKNQKLNPLAPSLDRVMINPAFGSLLTAVGDATIQFQPLVVASSVTQLWQLDSSQLLRSKGATNKCLDAPEPRNGGTVRLLDCSATNVNQLWTYDSTTKQLRHKTHVGFCLDIGTPTGEAPHLWTCLPTNHVYEKNQVFVF
ncbi:hypothetical protein DYB30_012460 [Aphanomyces astaci]|uniref:Ricin B lectin domain-containing protein n=1 Tax=Aphanomyces astaci TaxID=112090 RepID=A0A397FBK7_APHAT|nr:hypothetical protein AaE_007413 [Aphanomyces astaci]RHY47661.1 hypothetical protein DYB34_013653 [Aphanomyces astaci]RHY75145.1 hypothetical protein DYB30_012460 [Aphanomyces astaci]RHZ15512.1 hypothetical protein DYB31_013415 [Aphanomyces astaci]